MAPSRQRRQRGGPKRAETNSKPQPLPDEASSGPAADEAWAAAALLPLGGSDDTGRSFATLGELWSFQDAEREALYRANAEWWKAGYGGHTDAEAMIGDADSDLEVSASASFLDALLARRTGLRLHAALDAGAGVGRVTKHVLLKRAGRVVLLEADAEWSKQSRRYLGKKKAASCEFVVGRLEAYVPQPGVFDLIWVQWVLQYLTDADVVRALQHFAPGLSPTGCVVLKENRPYLATSDQTRFQMDTPAGENQRYDITRTDEHHRALFSLAGLRVAEAHRGDETTFWVLEPASRVSAAPCEQAPEASLGTEDPAASSATGGTRAGVSRWLKGQNANVGLLPPSSPSESGESGESQDEASG